MLSAPNGEWASTGMVCQDGSGDNVHDKSRQDEIDSDFDIDVDLEVAPHYLAA